MTSHNIGPAVGFMMVSVALYATQDVLVKLLPPQFSVVQIAFFRSLFGLFVVLPMCLKNRDSPLFFSDRLSEHVVRSLLSIVSIFCFMQAFRLIPLAEAYLLTFSCPLFLTALSPLFLKEQVSAERWFAVIAGFMGVLIMLRPDQGILQWGSFIALIGGLFYSVSLVLVRNLARTDTNSTMILNFSVISLVVFGGLLPFYWEQMSHQQWAMMFGIGLLGASAQCAMIQAFRMAEVSSIAPFDYAALLWAVGYGYFIFGETPSIYIYIGGILIIVSGLFLVMREQKNGRSLSTLRN